MLLCGAQSLRDVIAFPKTQKGTDQMTDAPTPVSNEQLEELGVQLKKS
jgi:aspartyl-tRNA synthetase